MTTIGWIVFSVAYFATALGLSISTIPDKWNISPKMKNVIGFLCILYVIPAILVVLICIMLIKLFDAINNWYWR